MKGKKEKRREEGIPPNNFTPFERKLDLDL